MDAQILAHAEDLVDDGIHNNDMAPTKLERMELIAEVYKMLIEIPGSAEALLKTVLKIHRKK